MNNKQPKNAMTLIIAVGIMLILALMGWTVVNFAVGDYYSAARFGQSQKALYLAEAGASWARTNASCQAGNLSSVTHDLGGGQYSVNCNISNGAITINAYGYLPSQSACAAGLCQSQRALTQTLQQSNLNLLIQAQNYLDWHNVNGNGYAFDGDIRVAGLANVTTALAGYNGDGDANHNELTNDNLNDYSPSGDYGPSQPHYTSTLSPAPVRGFMSAAAYPVIDMEWLRNNTAAATTWPGASWLGLNNWDGNTSDIQDLAQVPWLMVPVGQVNGTVYQYAQAFKLTGNNNDRTPRRIRTLLGPIIGTSNQPLGNVAGSQYGCAQSFTTSAGAPRLTSVSIMHGRNNGNPTGRVTLSIVKNSSGQPSSLAADILATATYRPRRTNWNNVRFRSSVTLAPATTYWLVLTAAGQPSSTYYTLRPGDDSANPIPGVMRPKIDNSWDVPAARDLTFRIYFRANPTISSTLVPETLDVAIYNDNGSNTKPGTTELLHTSYSGPTESTWTAFATFNDTNTALTDNATYWLVWQKNPIDLGEDNYFDLRLTNYGGGNMSFNDGAGWKRYPSDATPSVEPDVAFDLDRQHGGNIQGDGTYVYVSQPNYFTGMTNEALRNYDKTGNWDSHEWAVIASVNSIPALGANGTNIQAILDRPVIYDSTITNDWYDDENIALIKRFVGSNATAQNWYISSGAMFDASSSDVNQTNKSFVTENDIGLVGSGTRRIILEADLASPRPILATQDGDIYSMRPSTAGTDPVTAQRRTLKGLIYTQNGDVTFDYLWANATAICGYNLYFSNYINASFNSSYIGSNGFSSSSSANTWLEK